MSAATDFVHDEEIVAAVLRQLAANLPEDWTAGESPTNRAQRVQFGDLREHRLGPGQRWRDLCPMIFVRLDRSERTAERCGLGGKEAQVVPLRLVHIRTREQCPDPDDPDVFMPPARARPHYAKIVSRALFVNRDLGNPTLTTDDASARVIELRPRSILYEGILDLEWASTHGLLAFALDFEVLVRTQ